MIFNFRDTKDAKTLGGHKAEEYVRTDGSHAQSAVGKNGYIAFPLENYYSHADKTGRIRITLPMHYNGMLIHFKVTISNYTGGNGNIVYYVGGNPTSSGWMHTTVYSLGAVSSNYKNLPVRFGDDGNKCVITIGDDATSWSYFQVVISDIQCWSQEYEKFSKGWTIDVTSDNTDLTINSVVENPFIGENYVPINGGGTVVSVKDTPLIVRRSNATATDKSVYIGYIDETGTMGWMGFKNGEPYVYSKGEIIHTGNIGSHALPRNGGRLTSTNNSVLEIESTNADESVVLRYIRQGVTLGYLGYKGTEVAATVNGQWCNLIHAGNMADYVLPKTGGNVDALTVANNAVLHTGNSAKTVISDTAPSDTTALWIDTSE